jgi:hypothetical protein
MPAAAALNGAVTSALPRAFYLPLSSLAIYHSWNYSTVIFSSRRVTSLPRLTYKSEMPHHFSVCPAPTAPQATG